MKHRNGFVSNSSSTSFIVIDTNDGYVDKERFVDMATSQTHDSFLFGYYGQTHFGWENIKYCDVFDRINFAYLQCLYGGEKSEEWQKMLEKSILDFAGKVLPFEWNISLSYNSNYWGYIDHQSAACEGVNIDMFDSEQILNDFLFGKGSFIHTGNDND